MPPYRPGYFVMTEKSRTDAAERSVKIGGDSWFCAARVNTPPCPRYDSPSLIRGTLSPGPPDTLARGDPDAPLRSRGSLAAARSRCF